MSNAELSRVFHEIADLLEISGDDSFRVTSYRRAGRTLEDLAIDVRDVAARGGLRELDGIGKSCAEHIQEYLRSGEVTLRRQLAERVPETLLELRALPGVGPKRIALLWRERGITSLEDLRNALDQGALAGLKGLGEKSIEQLRAGLEFVARSGHRTRLDVAWTIAELLRHAVSTFPGVKRVEHAGSLRRGCESVGDLDLVCTAADGPAVIQQFVKLPQVLQVIAAGETKASVRVRFDEHEIQADLRVVPEEFFGAAWQYFTGSKEHNVRLRELAVRRGWSLNEYALTENGNVIASRREEDIYRALGLPRFPPEMRENRGEFELTAVFPDLLRLDDVRGDLHMHTVASDGRATALEMAQAARARGYAYACITDHSPSSVLANGLKPDRLLAHIQDIRRTAEGLEPFTLLAGAEVDILMDGRLDYPDEILAQLDFVIASMHVPSRDAESNTRRAIAALQNPFVNVLAHPTGRLLGRRDAMPIDVEAVAREAARTGTALELNASSYRLDLRDQHVRLAAGLGAHICLNTDAHAPAQLDHMMFGVVTARRGWLRRGQVLNTRDVDGVRDFVRHKRAAAGR